MDMRLSSCYAWWPTGVCAGGCNSKTQMGDMHTSAVAPCVERTSGRGDMKRFTRVALSGALAVAGAAGLAAPAQAAGRCGNVASRPWCDTALSVGQRADLLIAKLTLDEKISLLAGDEYFGVVQAADGTHTGTSKGVERLGIPTLYLTDGPVGARQGKATQLPSPMSVASSFDPNVAYRAGSIIADEAKRKGNDAVYAPGINMLRTPVNGRTFEYFGEDPYLSSRQTVGFIKGVQAQGVMANVKHFAVNNQEGIGVSARGLPIGGAVIGSRMTLDARVDERTLREIYLPAFEAAVKDGRVHTVMCAYPRVNGSYACENKHLLKDILKGEWGFRGFVLSDYTAAKSTVNSLNNGLDLDIYPGLMYAPLLVKTALTAGLVSQATVTAHVRRILRTMFAAGIFDRAAYVEDSSTIDFDAHDATAAVIEARGMVLLKNTDSLLPFNASSIRRLAVIGPEADVIKDGGGSSKIDAFKVTTPLTALRAKLGNARVVYSDGKDAAAAAELAKSADAAVVIVGDQMIEGVDKLEPTLNSGQTDGIDRDALISAVAAAQPNTVVVLQTGGPVLTPWRGSVRSILEAWYPGQNGGTALARVLFGATEPTGRLTGTFPAKASDLPTAGDLEKYPGVLETVKYKEGVFIGYRHYDKKAIAPAFPFGYGLGYTTFSYSRPVAKKLSGSDVVRLTFTVKNIGSRTGTTVPQLYVGMPNPSNAVLQPPKQLKAFVSLKLAPGERRSVSLTLNTRSFGYWNTAANRWRVATGCYRLMLAKSSRHVQSTTKVGWGTTCGSGSVRVR